MSRTREHSSTAPLGVKTICVLVALSAIIAVVLGLHFLLQGDDHGTVVGSVLLALAVLELVIARGLWTLKPWSWYGGMGLFGLAAIASLYVMLLKLSLLAFVRFLVDVTIAVYIYHKRDIYTPGTQARYDAIRSQGVLATLGFVREMKRGETAPLGMRLIVGVVGLLTVVTFFQGVYYIWGHGGAGVVFGLLLVLMAVLQAYVLYGLWNVERWGWFAGLFLFGLATVLAAFRIFLYNDAVAVVEFFCYGGVTLYTFQKKPTYAPRVTVDLTPR